MEKSKRHYFLPHNASNLLDWEEVVLLINDYAQTGLLNRSEIQHPETYTPKFDKNFDVASTFILHNLEKRYPDRFLPMYYHMGIESIYNQFIQDYPDANPKESIMTLYCSLVADATTHGIHRDTADVYIYQQLGQLQIDVYDRQKHTYILSPGDIIHIPKGMYHNTKSLTPRATLSTGWFTPGEDDADTSDEFYQRNNIDTSQWISPFLS